LGVNGEYQEQVLLLKIIQEGEGDPIRVMKMVSSYISHLESQEVKHQKAKSIEAALWKDQLEVMRGDAKRLEILVAEGFIVNIWWVQNDLAPG
jgi:hypothetical protein